jgi:CheY-like chemotaxis protein
MSGLNLDITERKQFEQSIAEQDRKKDEFLATLAHELRNPLAPLRSGLDVLDLSADPDESSQTRDMMRRQLSQMVRLIDDLMDVSRINSGKVVLRRERLQLQSVLEAALEASRPQIEAARHRVTFEVPREPIWLDADAARLTQVISNLLTNAAKYTPDCGEIVLSANHQSGEAVVSVRDNGLGIPAALLDEVFEMFAQVNQTLERAQGGLGIGLALVRRLVVMHGGSISVKSEGIGRGSTFTVKLPLAVVQQAVVPQAATREVHRGECLRILVVDDNADAATSLSKLLRIHRHDVQTAFNGGLAIAIAREFRPDVVFLDIGLPDMKGHEVASQILEVFSPRSPVLVALTGWGTDEDRRRTEASGFTFHLTKPVAWTELQAILNAAVPLSRS